MKTVHRLNALRPLAAALLLSGLLSCAPEESAPEQASSTAPAVAASASPYPWKVPTEMPTGQAGEQIRYGEALIAETARHLGPDVSDPALRVSGNHMACKSCHLDAGKRAHALGFVGVASRYPAYRGRENREVSLAERVNGCFERSMNGRPLAEDSPQMQAILAYMQWLSQDIPQGAKVAGQGLPEIPLLDRAADPAKGAAVYQAKCSVCHQASGAGLRLNPSDPSQGYTFPPLWGSDSYNNGAGMGRVITAARYIKANMPFGAPNLTDAEAFDVAAYINSQARPVKANLAADYPDRSKKLVDAPFPPWDDAFPAEQHKYGPFQPILDARAAAQNGSKQD